MFFTLGLKAFADDSQEALNFFNSYVNAANTYSPTVATMYSPNAKIIRQVVKPDGGLVDVHTNTATYIKQMKIGGLKVVDKNMQFYLEANYKRQKNRKPLNDYLTPMIKNNLKLRPVKIKSLLSFVHIQLTRKRFEPMHLSQESMNALRRFVKRPNHTAFDINATRQL